MMENENAEYKLALLQARYENLYDCAMKMCDFAEAYYKGYWELNLEQYSRLFGRPIPDPAEELGGMPMMHLLSSKIASRFKPCPVDELDAAGVLI